jgi:hypothetical protein
MSQPEGLEHRILDAIDHGAANRQRMFPLLSTLILPDFTTYVFTRYCHRPGFE